MRLARCVAAPAIERVVERHPGFELLKIVGIHARQPERRRKKARRFGREIEAGGIRAANDRGQPQAARATRAPVPRSSRRRCRPRRDGSRTLLRYRTARRRTARRRLRLPKALRTGTARRDRQSAGSARAGYPVDFWPLAGHPQGPALSVARRQLAYRNERQAALRPCSNPPSRTSAEAPASRSRAATPWLTFRPFEQMTTTVRP